LKILGCEVAYVFLGGKYKENLFQETSTLMILSPPM
jgi:hypothetical protein